MQCGAVGQHRAVRAEGRHLVWVVVLALLVAACRQAPPSLDTVTQTLTPEGGVIALPGGVSATFAPGFLAAEDSLSLAGIIIKISPCLV